MTVEEHEPRRVAVPFHDLFGNLSVGLAAVDPEDYLRTRLDRVHPVDAEGRAEVEDDFPVEGLVPGSIPSTVQRSMGIMGVEVGIRTEDRRAEGGHDVDVLDKERSNDTFRDDRNRFLPAIWPRPRSRKVRPPPRAR